MKYFKNLRFVTILLSIIFVFFVGFTVYGMVYQEELPALENQYQPNSKITDLTWDTTAPTFYYFDTKGISALTLDGKVPQQIYANSEIHRLFLLEPSQKIVAFTPEKLFLMDKDGKNVKEIFSIPRDSSLSIGEKEFVSPDQDKIVFFVTTNNGMTPQRMYVFDLKNEAVTELADKSKFLSDTDSNIQSLYWLKDNNHFVWLVTSPISKDEKISLIETSIADQNSQLLKEVTRDKSHTDWRNEINITNLVPQDQLALPTRTNASNIPYFNASIFSPDMKQTLEVDNQWGKSTLLVNSQKILSWNSKQNGYVARIGYIEWIDSNHLLLSYRPDRTQSYSILELSSHKIAHVPLDNTNLSIYFRPDWFGKKSFIPTPKEW